VATFRRPVGAKSRQPRDVQLEVYEFLANKFGPKSGGK
jgi:hypothetical protein